MSCSHHSKPLEIDDRDHVFSPQHNNCVKCVAEDLGPLTQEEIARFLGVTKARVNQIERDALAKFMSRLSGLVGSDELTLLAA